MEKLIELLNEYAPEDFNWCAINGKIFDKEDRYGTIMNVEMGVYVISKQFGFIKWLVENDKIELPTSCAIDKNNDYSEREIKSDYESLLMLLAISDTPIDFLCEIIKK